MDKDKKQMFEALLLGMRDELLQKRQEIDRAWLSLHMNEIELEENASNEHLAAGLEQLDELEERQIEDIDYALGRIRTDQYDICESCGGVIAEKRLEAVPWTTRCIECSAGEDRKRKIGTTMAATPAGEGQLPPELRGLSDEQLQQTVIDAVERDGRVPTDELTVTCRNKVIRLEGALPSERFHRHLLQIVNDVLGFRDVEDWIKIDRTAWARRDRTPGIETGEPPADDSIDGGGTEMIEALKESKTVAPADEIIPEKRGTRK